MEHRNGTKAVIFDMDGVIVDSEPRHERAYLEVVRAIGYGDNHGLTFSDYIGRSEKELWDDFVSRHNPPHTLEELLALKRDRMLEIIRSERPLFPGLSGLIRSLAPHYCLGVASGSERQVIEEVLLLDGLAEFIKATVSFTEVPRGKPAPDIFLRAADLLGVAPEDCWVIEDSKPGVAAGLAAGMKVIAITNTHAAEELSSATFVADSYKQIADLLLH